MEILAWITNWYKENIDGDWEHCFGITIDTLDNPGWSVVIDIEETNLVGKKFAEIEIDNSENDWIICQVKNMKFEGFGDADKLEAILTIFKDWAESD